MPIDYSKYPADWKTRIRLCPKGSLAEAKRRTEELMRLAAACRLVAELLPMVDDEEMKGRMTRFLRPNVAGEARCTH